jgi:hypothetical protein
MSDLSNDCTKIGPTRSYFLYLNESAMIHSFLLLYELAKENSYEIYFFNLSWKSMLKKICDYSTWNSKT